jgi:hypothetical protein
VLASFPEDAVDVTPEMQELKNAGAQAVYLEGLGAPAGYALKAHANLAWNAPIVFDIAAGSLDITKLAPMSDDTNAYEDVYYEMHPRDKSPGLS